MDGETNTPAARGLEELFFQMCCCVSFWFWREIGFDLVMMDRLFFMDSRLSEIWRELALHYLPAVCFGIDFFRLKIFFWRSF
jgi:hypothetical protein